MIGWIFTRRMFVTRPSACESLTEQIPQANKGDSQAQWGGR